MTEITKGIWQVDGTHGQYVTVENEAWICDTESGRLSVKECQANAKLIAEAGTVKNETGFSPRQLADQKAELLGALDHLAGIQKEFGEDSSGRKIIRVELEDWKLILKAIKNSK